MTTSWRVRLALLGVVALLLCGLGAYWPVLYAARSRAAGAFQPHLAEYLAPVNGAAAPRAMNGAMVVLDKASKQIDWDVYFALPDGLRAAGPEQVGTVVWLEFGRVKDDHIAYGNQRIPAYRQTCAVMVIDQASRTVISAQRFVGGDPPGEIDEHAIEGVGPKPIREVVDYLKSLPRQ